MTLLQDIGNICADGINRVLSRVITLEGRVTSAEANLTLLGAQVPPPTGGFTIETVNWTNLSEITLGDGSVVVSGGSVQATGGGGLYKISGSPGYNAGASSVLSIGGNTDGYFQFSIAHASHSAKIGLVYSDHDYSVDQPYLMNFGGGNIDLYNPWIADHTPFVAGDWIRIRHYASNNEIHFQKRQEIAPYFTGTPEVGMKVKILRVSLGANMWADPEKNYWTITSVETDGVNIEAGDLSGTTGFLDNAWRETNGSDFWEVVNVLGEDYVTFYTHPTPTNGNDLFLDTSFHFIGAGINDVQIATT